jgi:superfamily II DNA or RNA helicase
MASLTQLLSSLSPNEQVRGRQFESVCKWFLENDPEYKRVIKCVWLWKIWPGRWGRDKGIDLVAETYNKELWAIQSKAYAASHSVTKHDIDKFLSESSRKVFSYRLLIATAADLSHNAKEVLEGQEKSVGTLFLSDLKKRKLNWPSSPQKLSAKQKPPKRLRPDQRRAVADVLRGFRSYDRGQLIRACGTGKTLIGLRLAEAMNSQRTLVLVPSLSLVSQILSEWTKDGVHPFTFLPVCSDETVGREDYLVSYARELGVPATTKVSEIAEFLQGPGTKVVFATYQSSPRLALAFKKHRLKPFDLAIADEAHRCAGANAGDAATILNSKAIPARKRLFMTATPRIASEATKARADSLGIEVISMDDVDHFGPVFHELKFSDAIRLKLLTDYCVEIIGVDDPMYKKYAEEGVFVTLDGKTVTDARTLTSHIALAKAIKKHDLRRIITFHGRVDRAAEFAEQFPKFSRWMPKADAPRGEIWSSLVSGKMTSSKRDAILDRLREVQPPERAIVTNARCLSEGVDVQALDGVAFIDPKESQVDIIQAVGRAIRRAERKEKGVIILPVYISSNEDEEKTLDESSFKHVWRVLRALRSHDNALANELDALRVQLSAQGKVRAQLPEKIRVNLPARISVRFTDSFYLRTVRALSPAPPLTIAQILEWADAHHRRFGKWPEVDSGEVQDAPGENWRNINMALDRGSRGLLRNSSLAKLLSEQRGVRNNSDLPDLMVEQILEWADAHHRRFGRWPEVRSGEVKDAPEENWGNINMALNRGGRGLVGSTSLPQLLASRRGVRNATRPPNLAVEQVLKWADHHYEKRGKWPNSSSGMVHAAPGESWRNINMSLHVGRRGLPIGLSLAKLLAEKRGVRNPQALPKLTAAKILHWADVHHRKTGEWPTVKSGPVIGAAGEDWASVSRCLHAGGRGLPGKSSLGKLLAERRGVRNRKAPPMLTIHHILKWADAHRRKTGEWPTENSGEVFGAPGENWNSIANAFYRGGRGLPGNLSLAKLLAERRGVRSTAVLRRLTVERILEWADAHYRKRGVWPNKKSGEVFGAPGEDWKSIAGALYHGGRGLRKKSSLAKLLAEKRGVPHPKAYAKLTTKLILRWANAHHRNTGEWPNANSGAVFDAPRETWSSIATALYQGGRGLRNKSSLTKLVAAERGASRR